MLITRSSIKQIILFAIILLSYVQSHFAQQELKFERLTTDNGLPANYVLKIFQDHKGFIWIAMRGGCCRYDGISFKTFPIATPGGNRRLHTWVRDITQDKKNRLWVGEMEQFGLLKFDYDKEVFVPVFDILADTVDQIRVSSLMCDRNGELWIGTGRQGVIKYNPDTHTKIFFKHKSKDPHSIQLGFCSSIMEEKNGTIWIGTHDNLFSVSRYNRSSQKFFHYRFQPDNANILGGTHIECIIEDSDSNIWIGIDNGGLNKYNRSTDSFERILHNPNHPNSLPHNSVYSIAEDAKKRLWIGTIHGLSIMDKKKNRFQNYFHSENNTQSLTSNLIRTIFTDNTGNIWIGTGEGISKLKKQIFKTYRHSTQKNSISHNKVQYIIEAQKNKVWIATPKGIDVFDNNTGIFSMGSSKAKRNSTAIPQAVLGMHEQPNKGIWIATFHRHLYFYNYHTHNFSKFLVYDENGQPFFNKFIWSVLVDKRGNILAGTQGGGLQLFDPKTNKYYHYIKSDEENSLPSNTIRYIFEDSKNKIWIGTSNGAAVIKDIASGLFKRVFTGTTLHNDQHISVYNILDTKNGEYIWFATEIGLLKYHVPSEKLVCYSDKDGLPSSQIYGVLEDNMENLWISTSKGLSMIKTDYVISDTILYYKNYGKSDGLQNDEFLPASCCKLHNGAMLFGGVSGFSMFYPDSIKIDPFPPLVAITDLKIFNKSIQIGQEINGQVILNKSITNTRNITINHKNNNFTFEFVALHFNQPQKNKYAFKLEGINNEWLYTSSSYRRADYMNLNGGEYVFQVRASNSDGIWNKEGVSMNVIILPPWWLTWWFLAICFFFMVSTIFFIVKLRTYNLSRQKQKLEKIVEQRTSELKEMNLILEEGKEELELQANQLTDMNKQLQQSNNELEQKNTEVKDMAQKVHDADQKQLRFFANISHEFRTPLTLIIAPLDKYANKEKITDINEWNNINKRLRIAFRNAKRLLRLVNQIIDFRMLNHTTKTRNLSNNNIIEFIEEITNAFSPMAEVKKIQIRVMSEEFGVKNEELRAMSPKDQGTNQLYTHYSPIITQFWFDPDIMEKILYNLISNAIKYTPEDGEISIQIRVKSEELKDKKTPLNKNAHQQIDKSTNQHNNNNSIPQHSQNSSLITHHSLLEIIISDTGIGINPENQNKIFDRFYRVQSKDSEQIEGAGIGLAYTKELIEIHNGKIHVKSTPEKGSCFILSFPFCKKSSTVNKVSKNKNSATLNFIKRMIDEDQLIIESKNNSNYNIKQDSQSDGFNIEKYNKTELEILVVEDNEDMREFIVSELQSQYKIIEAKNGREGIDIGKTSLPDLIISDIMMPEINGTELCRIIKTNQETSHIPIILLTAKSGEENMIKGLKTGADDYITKPFNINILKLKIQNILRIRQQLREKFALSIDLSPDEITTTSIDSNFLKKAITIVESNMQNPDFTNDRFIRLCRLSKPTVYKKIRSITNQSLSEFIRTIRLKNAAKLLLVEDMRISEIGYMVGFKNRQTFTRDFTKLFGKTPTQYIEENQKKK